MRQVKVLTIGLLVAVALAVTLHAQNYVWSSINGVPYAPGIKFADAGSAASPQISFGTGGNGVWWDSSVSEMKFVVGGSTVLSLGASSISPSKTTFPSSGTYIWNNVNAVTTTYQPADNRSFGVYTNEGDSDGAAITLSGADSGRSHVVCVQTAQTFTITAAAGDTIRIGSVVTAAGGSISSNVVGSCVWLMGINTTEWVAISATGSWSF